MDNKENRRALMEEYYARWLIAKSSVILDMVLHSRNRAETVYHMGELYEILRAMASVYTTEIKHEVGLVVESPDVYGSYANSFVLSYTPSDLMDGQKKYREDAERPIDQLQQEVTDLKLSVLRSLLVDCDQVTIHRLLKEIASS